MPSQHDQDHGDIHDEGMVTPHSLAIVPHPIIPSSPSVQELGLQDAAVTYYERKRKRPKHFDDFTNPDTDRIEKGFKQPI